MSFSSSSSSPALFQHMHLFYKTHDCPFHKNQEPWRGRAPVFKSCLASGRQSPPGRLPPLSAVVERAIWTMERSVFPISGWFPLPSTPPTPTLQPGLRLLPLGLLQIGSMSLHTSKHYRESWRCKGSDRKSVISMHADKQELPTYFICTDTSGG